MEKKIQQQSTSLEIHTVSHFCDSLILRKIPLDPKTFTWLSNSTAASPPTTATFCSQPEAEETLLLADNFDPFAASLLYFQQSMQWIQTLLTSSECQIVLKTSSPLVLLASPLLQNPRVHVLFVLHSPGTKSVAGLAERVATLETLQNLGVNTQILWTERPEEQTAASQNAKRQLSASGMDFILSPERRYTNRELQARLNDWWTGLHSQDATLDTRCAA